MKKITAILLCALLLLCSLSFAEESAKAVDLFMALDYDGLFEISSDEMKSALGSAAGIKAVVDQLTAMNGDIVGMRIVSEAAAGEFFIHYVACELKNALVTFAVVSDANGIFSGLQIAALEAKPSEEPEPSGDYVEEPIILREGEADETNGLLTLPSGSGPFPCAVMLQGSGASDMNETAYGIRVFEMLSRALAQNGVATVRFDKYTYAHANMCASPDFTVDDEYLNDAQAAFDLLENDERVSSVFILGHSQGASLAPRIAQKAECGKLEGLVLVAGTPLALYEVIVYQTLDALNRGDMPANDKKALKDAVQAEIDMFTEAGKVGKGMTEFTAFGVTAHYLWDDASIDPAQTLLDIDLPALLIQAGKDFQVPAEIGEELWREALEGSENITYITYPNMTHLLFDLEGESTKTVADYSGEQTLNADIAPDIAEWVLSIS